MTAIRAKINDLTLKAGIAAYKRPATMRAFNVASSIIDPIGRLVIPNYQSGKTTRDILDHMRSASEDVQKEMVRALTLSQVRSLSHHQIIYLDYSIRLEFSGKQIQAMTPKNLEYMSDFTKKQIQAITPAQLSQVRLHRIRHLGKESALTLFSPEQVRAIPVAQLEGLIDTDVIRFTLEQVRAGFTDEQIRVLAGMVKNINGIINCEYWLKERPDTVKVLNAIMYRSILINQ